MLKKLYLALAMMLTPLAALSAEYGSEEEAVAMVDRAQALYESDGFEALVAAVNDPSNDDFRDRDLYVFVIGHDGDVAAHGANAGLVGRNLLGLKDQDGKEFVREMADVSQNAGSGWVSYLWSNPQTKKLESKKSWVVSINGTHFAGVGVYAQ